MTDEMSVLSHAETVVRIIKLFTLSGSHTIVVFAHQKV